MQGAVYENEIKFPAVIQLKQILSACLDRHRPLAGQPPAELKRGFTYVEDNDLRAIIGSRARHKREKTGVRGAGNKDPAQSAANKFS